MDTGAATVDAVVGATVGPHGASLVAWSVLFGVFYLSTSPFAANRELRNKWPSYVYFSVSTNTVCSLRHCRCSCFLYLNHR